MRKMKWKNPLMLFLAALIWGIAFVAQSVGMQYVGAFTFSCVRSFIGAAVLLPVIRFLDGGMQKPFVDEKDQTKKAERERQILQNSWKNPKLLSGGLWCGLCLCVASNLQQFGVKYTSVGKAGFITAMYIILVPVFGVFLKKKTGIRLWISVVLGVAGLYLLCMTGRFALGMGDALVLMCAVVFSLHILVIDHFSPLVNGVKLSCIQFLVNGVLSGICMLIFEHPQMGAIFQAWIPILYAGAMSCGVAYTLQIVGQKDMDPTVASLILSMESVFSVLAGWVILHQKLSIRELMGCLIMFAAIILAQLPDRGGERNK